jgi:hypothetical protein
MLATDEMFRKISESEAPALHRAVEELSRRTGIEKPGICYIDTRHSNALQKFIYDHNAGATILDGQNVMLFGNETKRMFGYHHGHSPVSDEFKAIIAHEMGHLKFNDVSSKLGEALHRSPYWVPLVAAAGVFFHDYLVAKKTVHKQSGLSEEEAHKEIHREWEASDTITHSALRPMQPLVTAAKMTAGAALGFATSLTAIHLWHRKIEFRADRVSAAAMQSGQPLIRAMEMRAREMAKRSMPKEAVELLLKEGPINIIKMAITHPTNKERFSRLASWTPSVGI